MFSKISKVFILVMMMLNLPGIMQVQALVLDDPANVVADKFTDEGASGHSSYFGLEELNDGKLFIYGGTPSKTHSQKKLFLDAVVTLKPDGTYEKTFFSKAAYNQEIGIDWPQSSVLLPDGSVLMAGTAQVEQRYAPTLYKYLNLTSGFRKMDSQTGYRAYGDIKGGFNEIVKYDDSAYPYVAVGEIDHAHPIQNILVMKMNANGDLDPAFGTGGKLEIANPDGGQDNEDEATGVFVHNGRLFVSGYCGNDQKVEQGFLLALDATGHLDPAFGTNGIILLQNSDPALKYSTSSGFVYDNQIYVIGYKYSDKTNFTPEITRYSLDGRLDETYAQAGHWNIVSRDGIPHTVGTFLVYNNNIILGGKLLSANSTDPVQGYIGILDSNFNVLTEGIYPDAWITNIKLLKSGAIAATAYYGRDYDAGFFVTKLKFQALTPAGFTAKVDNTDISSGSTNGVFTGVHNVTLYYNEVPFARFDTNFTGDLDLTNIIFERSNRYSYVAGLPYESISNLQLIEEKGLTSENALKIVYGETDVQQDPATVCANGIAVTGAAVTLDGKDYTGVNTDNAQAVYICKPYTNWALILGVAGAGLGVVAVVIILLVVKKKRKSSSSQNNEVVKPHPSTKDLK